MKMKINLKKIKEKKVQLSFVSNQRRVFVFHYNVASCSPATYTLIGVMRVKVTPMYPMAAAHT